MSMACAQINPDTSVKKLVYVWGGLVFRVSFAKAK